ncbi:hypothetical protein Salat_1701100 [Sesamum alatum]|uniref:Retrotransposon gag domain-containing protein n=1 Tax=Sesamum alatum TaxID=300844 RepID=A0AAE2CKA5_9LAMI|nr:hypothetical protein Salat_1701100 [Sesamum alatum]
MGPLLATLQQFFQYTQGQTPQAVAIPATYQALERFLHFQLPKFLGEPDYYKAESWLEEIEKIFKVLRYDDEQKISFSTFRFEEMAHNWWRVVEARWQREETPHTWINFVKEFNDKFVPQVVRDRREEEFVNLIQGSCTVAQYEARFNKLIKYAPYMLDDELRRTKKFIRGLRLDVQRSILACGLTTYTAAVERAMEVEAGLVELNRLEERVKSARPTPILQGTRVGKGPNIRRIHPGNTSGSESIPQQNRC